MIYRRELPAGLWVTFLIYTTIFSFYPSQDYQIPFLSPRARILSRRSWLFLLQSSPWLKRGFELYLYYQNRKLPPGLSFNYVFIALLPHNSSDPPNIAFPDNYMNWTHSPRGGGGWELRDFARMLFSLNYALQESGAGWIYRGYDDILINFDLLLPYMRELERRYDPLKEFVIRSDCVVFGPVYPQGGAGMLISRRALEVIAPMAHRAIWELKGIWDDQRMGFLLRDLKWPAGECSSSAFLDYSFSKSDWARVEINNFSGLPECQATKSWVSGCRRFLLSVRQLVFFHTGKDSNRRQATFETRMRMATNLWKSPPEVAVRRSTSNGAHLCYWRNATSAGSFFNFP
jgi:hypothetical protein